MAPSSPTVRLDAPLPPRTLDSPPLLPVALRAFVAPAATWCMNASTSSRLTAGTFIAPRIGLMCAVMRLRSVRMVLAFFVPPRRVNRRPASASSR